MAKDMTKGRIMPQLITFTIPLILGNLFQLTYNAADSIIVGKFVGDDALAAVGTSGPIMNMAILFISGMCMGAGILMSTLFGAKEKEKLERQISTTLLGGLGFSFIVTLIMIFLAPFILKLINVPEDIIGESAFYLRIIFVGLVFTFIYNFLSNTLRALGDSKTPLYFLVISSLFNIVGDLFFVVVLSWGVGGSAVSTVLSEGLCCLCCALYVKKKVPMLCLGKKWLVFKRELLFKTFSYGITSALQQMCVQLGKVFVQAIVNTQGVAFIAAFAAINRVDDFAMTPQQNIAHATTTFLAQNRGAGRLDRMKRGFGCGILIEAVYSLIVSLVTFFGAGIIMEFFAKDNDAEMVELGISYLRLIAVMYIIPGMTNIVQGFFRGIGDLKVTLISTVTNMAARVVAAHIFIEWMGKGFESLAWANLWGWIFMMLFELPMLFCSIRRLWRGNKDGRKKQQKNRTDLRG